MMDIKRSVSSFVKKLFVLHSDMNEFLNDDTGLDDYNMVIVEGLYEILNGTFEDASWRLRESVNWQNFNMNGMNSNGQRVPTLASLIADSTAVLELGYNLLDNLDAMGNKAGADAAEELLDLLENIPDVLRALPRPPRLPRFTTIDAMASEIMDIIVGELLKNEGSFELELADFARFLALQIRGSGSAFSATIRSIDNGNTNAPNRSFKTKQELTEHLKTTKTYAAFLKAYVERIFDIGQQMANVSLVYKTPEEPNIDRYDSFSYIHGTFTHYFDPRNETLKRSVMSTKRNDALVNERTRDLFERIRRTLGLIHPDDVLYES
jgi:hypothetical protein